MPYRVSKNEFLQRLKLTDIQLVGEYINITTKTLFKCNCYNFFIAKPSNILSGHSSSCGHSRRNNINDIEQRLNKLNIQMIDNYIKADTKIRFKCYCGNIFKAKPRSLFNGQIKSCGCYNKARIKISGKNHPLYDSTLTEEDRIDRRLLPEYRNWSKSVLRRDNYTCQICFDKGRMNAHHLNSWKWFDSLRFNLDNGITLCNDCHIDFHYIYGNKWNTYEEFIEYVEKY